MLFNSLEFVAFFAVVLAGYLLLRRRLRLSKFFLLLASYYFYMSWNWPFVLVLIGSTLLDYYAAAMIAQSDRPLRKRAWVVVSCVGNLGVLAFFKYGGFVVDNLWAILPSSGEQPELFRNVVLPLGISFYTFQTMSYTIDVYRGDQPPSRDLLDFALYVTFFPQLVAGPIIRSIDFLPQLRAPRPLEAEETLRGMDQAFRGFAKKVLLADTLGLYVDQVYAAPATFGAVNHWLAVYAYAFQIYFDFSGYTDIAIGTARILGFWVPINFRLPYLARNPSDFWTRWHISLSTWLRDYLYKPLGGSRVGHTYRNLMLTMLLGGLWHGAAWNFVLWGAFHGGWLCLHRALFRDRRNATIPAWLAVPATFHLTCIGWVLFRAHSLEDIPLLLRGLFDLSTPVYRIDTFVLLALLIGFGSHLAGASRRLASAWEETFFGVKACAYASVTILLFFFSDNTVRFIYFQF